MRPWPGKEAPNAGPGLLSVARPVGGRFDDSCGGINGAVAEIGVICPRLVDGEASPDAGRPRTPPRPALVPFVPIGELNAAADADSGRYGNGSLDTC